MSPVFMEVYKEIVSIARKMSLNHQLSDTFFYKNIYSLMVLIITSFLIGVNCVQLPFFPGNIKDFLKFPL